MKKKSVAPKCISLIIGDSQRLRESPSQVENSHTELCSQLLKNPKLRGWEKLFVSTLQKSSNPGRRQLLKLEEIASRLKKSRERKELTECLQVLENQGIQGELALFVLSSAEDGGES